MTTILIIEDDAQTRENLEIILDMEGFSVRSAANGREGIALAQAHHPDLVICDVSMPQLDGHEVLRQLRADAQTAAIPFIFLTARGEKQQQRTGMNLGADDYLCKPLDAEDLLAAVRARLQRRHDHHDDSLAAAGADDGNPDAVELRTLGEKRARLGALIARALGLDEDLTEALCLAHDIGHPPFGHAGEDALAEALAAR